jgi:glycosyltransferase involved in cell wall biosynthesis
LKVLLLSAYAAQSHVHWQKTLLAAFPDWQWRILNLPPRHFSWRVRGNALYWSMQERVALEAQSDLLIATSMVDLATLRGLVPKLTHLPTVLYFHENQFDYPQHRQQHNLLEAQLTSIYSALAADSIVFNSLYNQMSFMDGCTALLRKLPDYVPPEVVPKLLEKSSVIPVPFDCARYSSVPPRWPVATKQAHRPLRLLWVGRFEHDKGGDGLLRILHQLDARGLNYELAVSGQQFRDSPPVFKQIESTFRHRIVHFGYIERSSDYQSLLQSADVVLSTALHEFQGLAVMESVARGCRPVVPCRLVYPEIYPAVCCYDSHPEDPEQEAAAAATMIVAAAGDLADGRLICPDVSACSVARLAPLYEQLFRRTAALRDSL